MSSRRAKKRRKDAPMPATGAGLLRFFEEETLGVKIKPEIVLILTVSLIIICIIVQLFF